MNRTWILAIHWFIQQVFVEHLLCAWYPILKCGNIRVNPTDKALSLMEMTWPFMQSYFSLTLSNQLSTILCFRECFFCVSATCLDLPYKQVYFWGIERDYTHSVFKIRGGKSSCRLFKICIKIYKHDWHSSGSSPRKRWSCPQIPNGIKTHIKTVITEKCLKI